MKKVAIATLILCAASVAAVAAGIDGKWISEREVGAADGKFGDRLPCRGSADIGLANLDRLGRRREIALSVGRSQPQGSLL